MMDLSDRKTIGSVSRWKEDLDCKVDKVSRSSLSPVSGGTSRWSPDTGSSSRKQVGPEAPRGQDGPGILLQLLLLPRLHDQGGCPAQAARVPRLGRGVRQGRPHAEGDRHLSG